MTEPAPEGVEVRYKDGRVVPLECVYRGLDGEQHIWEAVLTVPLTDLIGGAATLNCKLLPAHTQIRVPMS